MLAWPLNFFFVIDEGKNDITRFVSITRVNVFIFILLITAAFAFAVVVFVLILFVADQWRQYDVLQCEETTFPSVDECSKRASAFSNPGYQLRPSRYGTRLNFFIKEHRRMFGMIERT